MVATMRVVFVNSNRLYRGIAQGWLLHRARITITMVIAVVATACTPPLELPKDIWDQLYKALVNGQTAQTQAAAIVKAHQNKETLFKDRIGLRAMLASPTDPTAIDNLPLEAWLVEDDFVVVMERYAMAATKWNALLDTAIAIIGTNRDITDWPHFKDNLETANTAATQFTEYYRLAVVSAQKNKQDALACAKGDKTPPDCGAGLNARRLDNFANVLNFFDSFSILSGSLIKTPIDILDIVTKISEKNQRERAQLISTLTSMKWVTVACLQNPQDRTCPTSAAPAKSSTFQKGGATPSKGSPTQPTP